MYGHRLKIQQEDAPPEAQTIAIVTMEAYVDNKSFVQWARMGFTQGEYTQQATQIAAWLRHHAPSGFVDRLTFLLMEDRHIRSYVETQLSREVGHGWEEEDTEKA